MTKFVFDKSLELGVTLIDDQHRRWVGYLNDAWDGLERGEQGKDFFYLLNQLMDYALQHFCDEEALMKQAGYPEYEAHRARHNEITEELFGFDLTLLSNEPDSAEKFLQFMTEWLRNHIDVVDREMADSLRAKGVR